MILQQDIFGLIFQRLLLCNRVNLGSQAKPAARVHWVTTAFPVDSGPRDRVGTRATPVDRVFPDRAVLRGKKESGLKRHSSSHSLRVPRGPEVTAVIRA